MREEPTIARCERGACQWVGSLGSWESHECGGAWELGMRAAHERWADAAKPQPWWYGCPGCGTPREDGRAKCSVCYP